VPHAKHSTKNARSPSAIETITAVRGERRGSVASLLTKTRRRSRRGAATSLVRRLTGARCRGHTRRRLPARPKCRHRGGHKQPRATRKWGRARDKQLILPERTSGRSALAWRPACQAPPGRRVPRSAKLTPDVIRGDGAPDVHVSLIAGGGQGPTPAVAEAGGSAPEQAAECVVATETADQSGAAPESAGSKRAAPEQGLSGRPTKKPRVGSKM
jgi:hypothetical protein